MNSVSKFLYFADVADKLGGVAGFWGILTSIGVLVGVLAWFTMTCIYSDEPETRDSLDVFMPRFKWLFKVVLCLWLFFGAAYILVPGKQTFYAIAAAQVGEQVVNSEAVQGLTTDALKALQSWIKRQIEPEKGK